MNDLQMLDYVKGVQEENRRRNLKGAREVTRLWRPLCRQRPMR